MDIPVVVFGAWCCSIVGIRPLAIAVNVTVSLFVPWSAVQWKGILEMDTDRCNPFTKACWFRETSVPQLEHGRVYTGRSRAVPESAHFRRAWSMDRTICSSRCVVYIAALQLFIFNADRTVLGRMVRYLGRTQASLSSQELALLLDTYVLFLDGEDAFIAPCFHPSENRATCFSTYR